MHYFNIRPTDNSLADKMRLDPLTTPNVVKSKLELSYDTTVSTAPSTNPFTDPRDNLCHEQSINSSTDPNDNLGQDPSIDPNINACQDTHRIPFFDPSNLAGRISLMSPNRKGQFTRAKIVEAIKDYASKDSTRIKFTCTTKNDQVEEFFSHNEVLNYIEDQRDDTAA